jgi:hypothetical protein
LYPGRRPLITRAQGTATGTPERCVARHGRAAAVLAHGTRWQRTDAVAGGLAVVLVVFGLLCIGAHHLTDVVGSALFGGAATGCPAGVWHGWLLPRQHGAPLLARFGPVTVAAGAGPVPERQPVG